MLLCLQEDRENNVKVASWRRWLRQNPDYLQEVERGLTQDLEVRPERLCGQHNLKDAEELLVLIYAVIEKKGFVQNGA